VRRVRVFARAVGHPPSMVEGVAACHSGPYSFAHLESAKVAVNLSCNHVGDVGSEVRGYVGKFHYKRSLGYKCDL
jgi:hypothetical protein